MANDFNGEWLKRRSGRRERGEEIERQGPAPTGQWETPVDPHRAIGPSGRVDQDATPHEALLHQYKLKEGNWQSCQSLRRRHGLSAETFYNRVISGDVVFVRAGDRLLYKWVHDDTVFVVGAEPGDTDEMASRQPPQLDHVGALAALADDLYVRLSDTERENRALRRTLEKAEDRLRTVTEHNVALSNQVDDIERRSLAYQTSFLHTRRALYVSNAELRHRREEISHLIDEIDTLSRSVFAAPVRKQLRALIEEDEE